MSHSLCLVEPVERIVSLRCVFFPLSFATVRLALAARGEHKHKSATKFGVPAKELWAVETSQLHPSHRADFHSSCHVFIIQGLSGHTQ